MARIRSADNPRLHKDFEPSTYDLPQFVNEDTAHWDMRANPRLPGEWPRHFNYYNLPVTAVKPNITRMCVLFNFMDRIRLTWAVDVTHVGPPHYRDGFAVTCGDVVGALYEMLQTPLTSEEVAQHSILHPYNEDALEARLERCAMFRLPYQTEKLRRIDFVKAIMGGTHFAGLIGFERMLSTPFVRVKSFIPEL